MRSTRKNTKPTEFEFVESEGFRRSLALSSALFVYLFLVFYQPFGVNNYRPHNVFSTDLIVGIIPLIPLFVIGIYVSERFLRPFLMKNLGLNLYLWFAFEFVLLGTLSFLLYNYLGNFHDWHWKSYFLHLVEVSTLLAFPFAANLFVFRYRFLKKDYENLMQVAHEADNMDQLLHLRGDYKKDQIALKPSQILLLESEDNYVALYYLQRDTLKKYLIRSSLKNMHDTLPAEHFIKCNRSQLVNPYRLGSYSIRSNRLWLKVDRITDEILVSKSLQTEVFKKIEASSANDSDSSL